MSRFAKLASLVLVASLGSLASANPIHLSLSKADGSNYNMGTNEFGPTGEQLSMGATVNVESRRVQGGSISLWTQDDNPNRVQGLLSIYGWQGGTMSPSPYQSLSMEVDGVYLYISNEVEVREMIHNNPMMYSTTWANVALENGWFTSASFDQNFYPQPEGGIWFSENFWFHGMREGEGLQAFSVTQSLSIPEPATLGLVGLLVPFALRRK